MTARRPAGVRRGRRARCARNQLLIFSRWCQVMLRFEKACTRTRPGPEQALVGPGREVPADAPARRPHAPDYASKIHIVSAPAYYHNYMMGELFAVPGPRRDRRDVLHGVDPSKAVYVGKKAVGDFMKKKVFDPGRSLSWNELTARHG